MVISSIFVISSASEAISWISENRREVNKLSIGKTRGILYKIAKFLGDFSAVSSGNPKKIAKRVGRRTAGKVTGKVFRKLFK